MIILYTITVCQEIYISNKTNDLLNAILNNLAALLFPGVMTVHNYFSDSHLTFVL